MLIDMNHFIERTSYLALASQISNLKNEEFTNKARETEATQGWRGYLVPRRKSVGPLVYLFSKI